MSPDPSVPSVRPVRPVRRLRRLGSDSGETARWLPVASLVAVGGVLLVVVATGKGRGLAGALPFLLVPVALAAGWWLNHKRVEAAKRWAATIGWTWVGADNSLAHRWRGQPFGTGDSRRVTEVMTGPFGPYRGTSFAYRYTTGSGKSRSTHVFGVIALSMPTFLPTLELTPENVGTRLVRAFGAQDLEFESEDFNRAWRVTARDPKFAHDVLHPRLLERLVRGDATGMSIRIEGTDILCWSTGAPDLARLGSRLGVLRAIVDAVPRYVWLDHGYDPAST
ncbi:hypothetical protein [Actinotalea sp.]|uniref:hypothetical protein n=1 Tax=Actinotalea sp. TaxID=1872145 RepID=UPI003564BC14